MDERAEVLAFLRRVLVQGEQQLVIGSNTAVRLTAVITSSTVWLLSRRFTEGRAHRWPCRSRGPDRCARQVLDDEDSNR